MARKDPPSSWPYVDFVSLDGKGSEQDTVGVVGMMRTDRREILIWVGDSMRGDPLPTTRKLVGDLHAALQRAFPDAKVDVETRKRLRTFAP
jgi:hypothetical protein